MDARNHPALRLLALCALLIIPLRIAGYGIQGLAVAKPWAAVLFYLIPLAGAAGALAGLMGFDPVALLRGLLPVRPPEPEPTP